MLRLDTGLNCGHFVLAGVLALAPHAVTAAEDETTPDQVVTAIEGNFGVTPGERRNHTKGTCAIGSFVGLAKMAAYSRSALFSKKTIPVVARFSIAGGNPKVPDTAKSPRGMALEFRLADGSLQHMTMLNTPMFGASQPKTFLDQLVAMKPDPATGKPDPDKMKAFYSSHPDSHALADFLAKHNPPVSFATSAYYSIHTFKFVDRKNKATLVRWRFMPRDGEKRLSDDQLKSFPSNFLENALIERTHKGLVRWDMIVTIGKPGDTEDNPTISWPDNRQQIKAGTLTISSAMPQKGADCEQINYDPLVMSDGIEPSSDPILLFRSPAYAISFAKRLSGD